MTTDIKKEFHYKPVHDKKFFNTKIKYYDNEAIYFHNEEVPKVSSYIKKEK